MKTNSFVQIVVALLTCLLGGCAVQTVTTPTLQPDTIGQDGYCIRGGRRVPVAMCAPGRNSVATAGTNTNSVSITLFGGSGGYRPAPVALRNDCVDTQVRSRMVMGGGRTHMARCNHCNWSGPWEIRQSHPCGRGIQTSSGRSFPSQMRQGGPVIRSSYYGPPGTVINGN